jgi:hypothetical protein
MRVLARFGYTMAGLALLLPAVAQGGMPPAAKPAKKAVKAKAPKKLCSSCQYRKMVAQGLRVPPPPALPAGSPMRGEQCSECGAPTAVVMSGKIYRSQPPSPSMMMADGVGRAVVGDEPTVMMAEAGGPLPIGVVAPRVAAMPASGPVGLRDSAVMPTSMASEPMDPGPSDRPHVLSHLLGVSAIGRDRAEARARRKEEAHAKIPYGVQPLGPVTDLPASQVYGRR